MDRRGRRLVRARRLAEIRAGSWPFATASSSARAPRWRITREHPAGLITDDVMIGVEWQIGNGCASSVMPDFETATRALGTLSAVITTDYAGDT
jgi:hypothetical protein